MKGWKLGLLIAVTLAIVIAFIVHAVVVRIKRRKEKKRIMNACDLGGKSDSIFVTLVSFRNAKSAGETIHNIFKDAHCPLRVYIGLCEFYDPEDAKKAIEVYEELVKTSTTPFCLKDHIRVIRVPYHESKGGFAARDHLERFLYRSEHFVLSLDCPARIAKDWDKELIEMLEKCPGRRSILTTMPETRSGQDQPKPAEPGTFLAVHKFSQPPYPVPRMAGFAMKKRVHDVVPSVGWSSSFAFSRGERIDEVPYPRNIEFAENMHDFIMSARLFARGWQFFHPPGQMAFAGYAPTRRHRLEEDRIGEGLSKAKLFRDTSQLPKLDELLKRMGVTDSTISARGRMGLTSAAVDGLELDAKLGSRGNYLSLLSRLELTGSLCT